MKIFLAGAGAFLLVCSMGAFCMAAASVTWGTGGCGSAWMLTFFLASPAAVVTSAAVASASK